MLSKSIKLALPVVFAIAITGCASSNNITEGKVVAVKNGSASVYVGSDTTTLIGKDITVRRLLPTNTVLEGEPLYSYQVVGSTVVNAESKANFVNIETKDIAIEKDDIIELTE